MPQAGPQQPEASSHAGDWTAGVSEHLGFETRGLGGGGALESLAQGGPWPSQAPQAVWLPQLQRSWLSLGVRVGGVLAHGRPNPITPLRCHSRVRPRPFVACDVGEHYGGLPLGVLSGINMYRMEKLRGLPQPFPPDQLPSPALLQHAAAPWP